MKYKRVLNGQIKKLSDREDELSISEASSIIETLARQIRSESLNELTMCEFDDGRKDWMVSFPKYSRIKGENFKLKQENEKLRKQLLDYITK